MRPEMLRAVLLCALALSMAACSTQPRQQPLDSQWEAHRQELAALTRWGFQGKVAIRGDNFSESARLRWTQRDEESTLVLSGPMGWKQLTLITDGSSLLLQRDGEWQSLSGSAELETLVGWELPTEYLPWWVKGLPAPHSNSRRLVLDHGRLQQMEQDGWQLHYDSYQQVGERILPERIRFARGPVSGKIILREWTDVP